MRIGNIILPTWIKTVFKPSESNLPSCPFCGEKVYVKENKKPLMELVLTSQPPAWKYEYCIDCLKLHFLAEEKKDKKAKKLLSKIKTHTISPVEYVASRNQINSSYDELEELIQIAQSEIEPFLNGLNQKGHVKWEFLGDLYYLSVRDNTIVLIQRWSDDEGDGINNKISLHNYTLKDIHQQQKSNTKLEELLRLRKKIINQLPDFITEIQKEKLKRCKLIGEK